MMTTEQKLQYLSVNRAFNVQVRLALDLYLAEHNTHSQAFIYFDLDNMKLANSIYGKQAVNDKIRAALQFRSTDTVIGQVYSGDEFVAIVPHEDAYGFARRLQNSLTDHGLSATILITDESDLDKGDELVAAFKDKGIKAVIIDTRKAWL